jgi:hypothetical protein
MAMSRTLQEKRDRAGRQLVLTTEQIIERLDVLASKLEGEGAYVGMITCELAIDRLRGFLVPSGWERDNRKAADNS